MKWFVVALLSVVSAAGVRVASPGMAAAQQPAAVPDTTFQDSLAAPPDTTVRDTVPRAVAPPKEDIIARVVALEAKRRAAMVASDTRTLAGIIAEDATYVHSTGILQKREELFRMLENKTIRYVSFDVEKAGYRAYRDDTVVGTGVQRIQLRSNGKTLVSYSRYTVVYARVEGEEKMVAYQSTPMPELATKAK